MKIFITEAFRDFPTTAAVAPSSRFLTRTMLAPLGLNRAQTVVELGSGTGAMTRAILRVLPPGATLISFEINPRFFHYLARGLSDPRLVLLNASAEMLTAELAQLGCGAVDAVVSSLGLGYMSEQQRHTILQGIATLLETDGVFTHFQYCHGLQFRNGRFTRFNVKGLFHRYFCCVQRRTVWRNIPPAYVYISSFQAVRPV